MTAPVGVVMRRAAKLAASRDRAYCAACGKTRVLNHPCPSRSVPRPRANSPHRPPSPDFHQWWLDRHTPEEIRELAAGLDAYLNPNVPQKQARRAHQADALLDGLNRKEA